MLKTNLNIRLTPLALYHLEQYCSDTSVDKSTATRLALEMLYKAHQRKTRRIIKKEFGS